MATMAVGSNLDSRNQVIDGIMDECWTIRRNKDMSFEEKEEALEWLHEKNDKLRQSTDRSFTDEHDKMKRNHDLIKKIRQKNEASARKHRIWEREEQARQDEESNAAMRRYMVCVGIGIPTLLGIGLVLLK